MTAMSAKSAVLTTPRSQPAHRRMDPARTARSRICRWQSVQRSVKRRERRCRGTVHGEWLAPSGRRDPVEMLEEQAASRVPELVPIRYGRMGVSPFTFYRGAAYLMAADLERSPRTGLTCSCAVMRTCRTSVRSPRRIGGWCSTSTTSTRRCPARSSGISSGWSRASRSPGATSGFTPISAAA